MSTDYATDTSLPPRIQVRRALRSGAFRQTQYTLQDSTGYCCLGVACVIAEQNGVTVRRVAPGLPLIGCTLIPDQPDVQKWLDMSDREHENRMGWNDDLGRTFTEIAKAF